METEKMKLPICQPVLRDSLSFFAWKMENMLQDHDSDKTPWEDEETGDLIGLMRDHMAVLYQMHLGWDDETDVEYFLRQCVHIANYAMMIYTGINPITENNVNGHSTIPVVISDEGVNLNGVNITNTDGWEVIIRPETGE